LDIEILKMRERKDRKKEKGRVKACLHGDRLENFDTL